MKLAALPAMLWLAAAGLSAADRAKPAVLAHRGGAALRPENTLAAFRHALSLGVDVLEFDMNVTADGRLVIHHDSWVNGGICTAPPESGVRPGPIALLTFDRIRRFDCGSTRRPRSPAWVASPGERMPSLEEFLEAVRGSRALLLGETKMPGAGSPQVDPVKFVDLIDAQLRRYGAASRFILQSGDYRTIDAMRAKNPAVRTCLLNARRFKPDYLEVAHKHGATHLMLRAADVDAAGVAKLHAAGITVYSGTANTPEEWRQYVDLKMDGILTDDPEALLRFLSGQRR
jgi:glycerophosphoryl diester phosphodiesterase